MCNNLKSQLGKLRLLLYYNQIPGKSPDDEDTEDSSLGRCPDGHVSRVAENVTNDCTEWKIAVGILAGLLFGLSILITIIAVSRYKQKISDEPDTPVNQLLAKFNSVSDTTKE